MNPILSPPDAVLVVGQSVGRRTRLESAVAGADVGRVRTADSTDDAIAVLEDADEIGCVVVADDCDDLAAFRRALVERDEFRPVICCFEGDAAAAAAVTRAGATTLLPAADCETALADLVADRLETYRRRLVTVEESDMLRSFLSSISHPLFVKDERARHLRMSDVSGGVTQETVLGKTDREVYSYDPEAAAQFYADDRRVIERGERIVDKEEVSGPVGNQYWGRVTKVPWYDDDGSIKGLLGLSYEITELKAQEQRLERLDNRFDQFASYVSHDVMNPLQIASAALEQARETGDDEAFETVGAAHDRIEQMLRDLGSLASRPPDVDPAELVDLPYTVGKIWSFVAADEATLRTELADSALVHAPAEGIRPVLENVLKNAIDHAGPDVTVTVGILEDGFYVDDDGPGVPPAERERITDHGYTTAEGGTGTGLAIVAELVERNGWTLTVDESPDGGARIVVRGMPVVPDPDIGTGTVPGDDIELSETTAVGDGDGTGTLTVESADGWWTLTGTTDAECRERNYHFAYAPVADDARVEARVVDVDHVNDRGAGGLMIRTGLEADADYGFLGRTVGYGSEICWRTDAAEDAARYVLDESGVEWIRLERVGNTVTYSVSSDGTNWNPLDQRRLAAATPVYVGLAVSSAVPGDQCTVTFADVAARGLEER